MREDQDAEAAGGFDEARRRDRLARSGGVAEAVAPGGPGVGPGEAVVALVLDDPYVLVVLVVFGVRLELGCRRDLAVPVAVSVFLGLALVGRDQLGQHAGERIDLVSAQICACCGRGLVGGEDPFESEHQPVAHFPAWRRLVAAGFDLGQRVVEGAAACGTGGERRRRLLAGMDERLAEPVLGAARGRGQGLGLFRRCRG